MPDPPAAPLLAAPDSTREAIAALVAKYRQNEDQYRSAAYNEAHCRRDFIEPLFKALGWDVHNEAGNAEQYREVVYEPSLKVGEGTKAPDYAFRLGGVRKFYVEAKKPSVRIHDEPTAAYQLRRYAWSAKLPLSILTDFDEFAVYDCRQRPNASDAPAVGRVKFLRFHEYLDQFDYLYSTFSPEAIRKGSFDRYVEDKRRHRGTAEVDAAFLAEIEGWRETLAKDVARHNPGLSVEELNFAVQATIDRILFFRIAEDRGVEDYGRLRDLLGSTRGSRVRGGSRTGGPPMKTTPVTGEPPVPPEAIYPALLRLYQEADAKYNAGLFDFSPQGDTLCPKLTISDKALKPILQHLYYPDSPYEFSVLGADILGAVYEQFLGKVIRLTPSGLAKVEEKPEVKKAGGVYYTPRYIVDYIVEHTVREALDEAGTPEKASSLRILDPACGSGSFLLGAYDCLLNWHLRYYTENDPETFSRWEGPHGASSAPSGPRRRRVARAASPEMPSPPLLRLGDEWRLSSSERKRILLNNLYGVDLDPQAVEVTKLNLLLKCMEGDIWPGIARQLKLLHDRVLPNIDGNIKCGNSLIGPDYFRDRLVIDPDEHRRVRPFDWNAEFPAIMKAGGFDCVIGNPPYIRIQNLTEFAPEQPPYLRDTYRTATKGNYDIYVVFVERALALGRRAARLGFILPNKFFATDYGAELRRLLAGSHSVRAVVDFGHAQVFEGPTTYTCILLLHKEVVGQTEYLRATRPEELRTPGAPRAITLPASGASWQFLSPDQAALDTKLRQAALALLAWPAAISRGSSTGADDVFMLAVRDEDLLDATGESIPLERELTRIPVFATDFGRYRFSPVGAKRVLFPYLREGGAYRLLAEDELRISYPHAYEHLRRNRGSLQGRRHSGPWYAFSAPRNLAAHERAQLLVPLLADRGSFALLGGDPRQLCLMASGGFSIQGFRSPYSPMYALGLLNSAVLFWLLGRLSNVFRAGWITCTKQYVGQLPIRPIDFSDPSDVARHDKMVALVGRMLDLHKRLPEAKTKLDRDLIERQIAATDDEIDALVYELYGLTDEEIAIVRGET